MFRRRTTTELFATAALLQLCSSRLLVGAACKVLLRAAEGRSPVLAPLLWAARRTVFRHFAAGERMHECACTAERLAGRAGAKSIVDWSSEEACGPEELDQNLASKIGLIESLKERMPDTASFVAVKLTALVEPALLEAVTQEIHEVAAALNLRSVDAGDRPPAVVTLEQLRGLSAADRAAVGEAVDRLATLASSARTAGIRLLLDAEQTDRQPAINLICRVLQQRCNAADAGAPVVYNTFQMYLSDAPLYGATSLAAELAHAREAGFTMAAKVVRGAYIASETAAGRRGYIQATKSDTDAAYDAAVASLLEAIAADEASCAIVVATHNESSVRRAVAKMAEVGLPPAHTHVHFAQILGMADHLTYALGLGTQEGEATHNSNKLLVYGDFGEVLPWMLRRLQENQDVLGAAARERALLWREVGRRLRLSGGKAGIA